MSGQIGVVSKYIVRGETTSYGNTRQGAGNAGGDAPESDRPAWQWGLDYRWARGAAVGYWASTINYSYHRLGRSYEDRTVTDFQRRRSVEHDFYATYDGTLGGFGYVVGATGYVYVDGRHADALETRLGLSRGGFGLAAHTLLGDVVWGNRGDTYWTLTYETALPARLAFTASLGAYTYRREGRFLGTTDTLTNTPCAAGEAFVINGCHAGSRPIRAGWRHLVVGIAQPVEGTPLTWGLQGILGGRNRFGIAQGHRLVASISIGF